MGAIKRILEEITLPWVNEMRIMEQAFTCPEDYVDAWTKLKQYGKDREEQISDSFLKLKKPKANDFEAIEIQKKLEGLTHDISSKHKNGD